MPEAKDLNPPPIIKNPSRVTKHQLTHVTVKHGVHVNIRVPDPFWKGKGPAPMLDGWDTTHDITDNVNRAIAMAVAAKMFFILEGPRTGWTRRKNAIWVVSIPPAKGRVYRQFRASSPAKALCAAIIDWLENPQEKK